MSRLRISLVPTQCHRYQWLVQEGSCGIFPRYIWIWACSQASNSWVVRFLVSSSVISANAFGVPWIETIVCWKYKLDARTDGFPHSSHDSWHVEIGRSDHSNPDARKKSRSNSGFLQRAANITIPFVGWSSRRIVATRAGIVWTLYSKSDPMMQSNGGSVGKALYSPHWSVREKTLEGKISLFRSKL